MIALDFLIIGQGIAGTLLSNKLYKAGISFLVIDELMENSASMVSGAVLNPWGGIIKRSSARRARYFEHAVNTYGEMAQVIGQNLAENCTIAVFHEEASAASLFKSNSETSIDLSHHFNYSFGCGTITPAAFLHNHKIIIGWRNFLRAQQAILEEKFDSSLLKIDKKHIHYKDIIADKIIFCGGPHDADLPFFTDLPFTRNRGDMLLLHVPNLPTGYVFHGPIRLIPRGRDTFWCGSNYNWHFENLLPDKTWRKATEAKLKHWLKVPFEILEHRCAQRPTTAGQIPLIGLHPKEHKVGIVNGLGTKGYSAGPFWVNEFVQQLLQPEKVNPHQAFLNRFLS